MKPRKGLIISVTIAVALGLVGLRLLRNKAHHHAQEKVTGDASFDVYADGPRIHLLTLRQHGDHQALLYKHIENGTESKAVELPHTASERIVSRRSNDVRIAGRGNHLIALWQVSGTGYGNRGPLRFAESRDGGLLWNSIAGPFATGRTDDQGFAAITVDREGKFHLVWLDLGAESQGPDLRPTPGRPPGNKRSESKGLRYATYSGGKWSPVETIDAATCQCCWNSIAVNSRGEVVVMYRALKPRDMATAKRGANGWVKMGGVDNFGWQIDACPHAGGGLALGESAAYAVTWTGHQTQVGAYINRGGADGKWNEKNRLGGKSARNPDVALNGQRVATVWDEFEGERRMVKMRMSPDAGAHWQQDEILTAATVSGSYPRIVTAAQGFTVFWSETQKNRETEVRYKRL